MKSPSTDWKELIAPDEAERFARQAEQIRELQTSKNAKWGKGRFLHRKPLVGAAATLTVHSGLPEYARNGLFAEPKTYEAVVRLSHGSFDLQANTKPDIRGFAVKVLGLSGPGSLGRPTDHQDFLLINHGEFASRSSDEFLELVLTSGAKGELGLLFHYFKNYGLAGALQRIQKVKGTLDKPFAGYNAESFSTAVPVAIGPYAGKVRLKPVSPVPSTSSDPSVDMTTQLTRGPVSYEMAVQFYTDEATTPIENPPALWSEQDSPFLPVATLTLTKVGMDLEGQMFDPWGGLEAHRPLGEIMRARKGAYYASQKGRSPALTQT